MKMTNRELETRYMHMKQTWKTLVDANVSLVDENKDLKEEIERLNNIINTGLDKLNTQLAFTSSYQLNYQSAVSIIEETKSILQGVDKN